VRQFEVYANPSSASAAFAPHVVVLQSHYRSKVGGGRAARKRQAGDLRRDLNSFESRAFVLALTELGSIWAASLRDPVGDLLSYEYEIRRALDRLFSGF
jgi:toxin CcdB